MLADSSASLEAAVLAGLTATDVAWTESWLRSSPAVRPGGAPLHEEGDPLLGKRPTLVRLLVTGAVADYLVLRIRSPFVREACIGAEAVNVGRNFSIRLSL